MSSPDPFLVLVISHFLALVILSLILVSFPLLLGVWIFRKWNRKFPAFPRKRTVWTVVSAGIFLVYVGWLINHFMFPEKTSPISLVGNVGLIVFVGLISVMWLRSRWLKLGASVAGFILFLSGLGLASTMDVMTYTGPSRMEQLRSLPYLAWVSVETRGGISGITKHDPIRALQGVNLYVSDEVANANLVNMSGEILHSWTTPKDRWSLVEFSNDGYLYALFSDVSLSKLDWESNVIWRKEMRFHHDIEFQEDGDIYALVHRHGFIFNSFMPTSVYTDYIVELSPEGKLKKEINLFDIFAGRINPDELPGLNESVLSKDSAYAFLVDRRSLNPFDLFHTNSIQVMNREIEGFCQKGDLLLSMRDRDLILVLNPQREEIVWEWGPGIIRRQHQPVLLDDGHILLFDNGDKGREFSRVIELDPLTKQIVWEYLGRPPESFYNNTRGSIQRLSNGNTLIVDSEKGRVIEVTPGGRVVWEFMNPEFDEDEGKRRTIYRMQRFSDPDKYPFLKEYLET